jgi:pilus assembly protein Flp/PilA
MLTAIARFLRTDGGASAIEYALIGGLLSVAIVSGAWALGVKVGAMYETLGTSVPAPTASST